MNPAEADDLVPTERVALLVWLLTRGHRFKTFEAAAITGIKRDSARVRLNAISRVIPLREPCKDNGFVWELTDDPEN